MEINLLTLVGIGLAAMFFGYFFGLFEGRGQANRKPQQEGTLEQPPAPSIPDDSVPAAEAEQQPALLELGITESGRPQLHIDGREVDAPLISAAQRRRLIELMVMLKPWVGSGPAESSAPPTSAVARAVATSPVAAVSARSERTGAPSAAPGAKTPPAVASQMSLVAQIDSILQERLAGTPLADRAIRLAEALHGGAIVFVGSTQYDGVDKVTDPEVQSAIRAAIAEWEKKYTPG